MVGYASGLPQATILDGAGKMTGAIPLRGESPSTYQRTGTTVRVRGFEQHPVVMACVRAIVDVASPVPLQNYRLEEEKTDVVAPKESVIPLGKKFPGQLLVDAPSAFLSAQRLRALTTTHFLLYGNAFWFLERPPISNPNKQNTKPPIGIRVIHPEDLYAVYVNQEGYPVWYLWRDVLGYPHTSPVTDIVHFRDLAGKGLVFGYPRAASALNDIIGDSEASEHVRQMVTNSGAPPAFALVNEETTPAEAAAAEERLYEKWVTRGGRGRFAFLGGVKDIKSIGFNLRDLEFPDLRRVAREDIAAAFGIDPRMIGIASASNDAGLSGVQYTEARVRLVQHTVEPMLRSFESELNLWLAPEFGDTYYRYDPAVLAAIVENHDTTSLRITREVAAGVRTVEEGRVELGLPAEFEDDDTLAITMGTQIIPVLIAMNPTEPIPPQTADEGTTSAAGDDAGLNLADSTGTDQNNPGNTPKLTDAASAPDGAPNRAGVALVATPPGSRPAIPDTTGAKLAGSGSLVLTRSMVLSPEQRTLLWQQWDTRATAEEAPFRRAALMQFSEERSLIAGLFARAEHGQSTPKGRKARVAAEDSDSHREAILKATKRQITRLYQENGEITQRWADRFHPIIGQTYAKGAEHVMSGLRATRAAAGVQRRATEPPPRKKGQNVPPPTDPSIVFDFHLHDPNVQQAIRARATRLADYVGQTTGDAVTTALEIGMREGMSISQIAKLIDQSAFGTGASYRANMIARTESIGALSAGQFGAAQMSGVVAGKEWLTQGDDRVRDSHAECEDEGVIPLDQKFKATGMLYPGDPEGDAADTIQCRCANLLYDSLDPSEQDRAQPHHQPADVVTRVDYVFDERHQLRGAVVSRGQFHPAPATLARTNDAASLTPSTS